jgi:ribosomal subunit interface protein
MTTTQSTPLRWNLVTKNVHGHELLRKKLHEKITKLEKHLNHFPPGTVHLQIVLERHPRKPLQTAALNLRLPSNILHSEESAPDVIKAFDDAIKSLLRELDSLKAELRRETLWKRKERREQQRELKASGFASEPKAEGTGPQSLKDLVGEFFQQLHFVEGLEPKAVAIVTSQPLVATVRENIASIQRRLREQMLALV